MPREQTAYYQGENKVLYNREAAKQLEMNSWIRGLLNKAAQLTKYKFTYALLNKYANGLDHIGFHSDNPDGMEDQPILIIALYPKKNGQRMTSLRTKPRVGQVGWSKEIPHKNGKAIIISGKVNMKIEHSIEVSLDAEGRISISLRVYILGREPQIRQHPCIDYTFRI